MLRIGKRLALCLSISNYYLLTLLVEKQGEGGKEGRKGELGGAKREGAMDVSNSSPLLSGEWKSCWHQHEYFSR